MEHQKGHWKFNRNYMDVIGIVLILVVFFIIRETISLPIRFQTFFSLLALGEGLYTIYLSLRKKKSLEKHLILTIGTIIIINKLYDPTTFEKQFQFSFLLGIYIAIGLALFRILLPLLIDLGRWFKQHTTWENELLKKEETFVPPLHRPTDKQLKSSPAPRFKASSHTTKYKKTKASSHSSEKISAPKNRKSASEYILPILLLILSLWTSVQILRWTTMYQSINTDVLKNNMNVLIPISLIILLSTIVVFIILCTYIKLVRIMTHVLKGEESPTIYIIGIAVVSFFLNKSGYFSQDKMLNLFTQGDLFSFPIAILIIYPFFVLSANTINQLLKNHQIYQKLFDAAICLAKKGLIIGYNILDSGITIIQFVTSDFLDSMITIIQTNDTEEEENE